MSHCSEVWKNFNKNDLTHSGAHYLMAIYELLQAQGYARLSDVSKKLNISKGSLSTSLKPLIQKKLVQVDENKHLFLSAEAEESVQRVKNTCSVITHLLADILGVDGEIAAVDACKVEHLLSMPSTRGLLKLLKALKNNKNLLAEVKKEMRGYEYCEFTKCEVCPIKGFCFIAQN